MRSPIRSCTTIVYIKGDQAPEDSAAWGLGQETFSAWMETATPLTLGHPTADHPMPNKNLRGVGADAS